MSPARSTCPVCASALPVGDANAGQRVRCRPLFRHAPASGCLEPGAVDLAVVGQPSASWVTEVSVVDNAADRTARAAPAADRGCPGRSAPEASGRSRTAKARATEVADLRPGRARPRDLRVVAAPRVHDLVGFRRPSGRRSGARVTGATIRRSRPARRIRPPGPRPDRSLVNIAYGTEKKKWLEAALEDFLQDPGGPGRSHQPSRAWARSRGRTAILDGPKPAAPHQPIHVWSPASSVYRDVLETRVEGQARRRQPDPRGREPRADADGLRDVEAASRGVREEISRRSTSAPLAEAMKEPGGWGKIAGQPEWGLFKFGHTDPSKSNSGLQTLVLMAYEFTGKQRGLTVSDIAEPTVPGLAAVVRARGHPARRLAHATAPAL